MITLADRVRAKDPQVRTKDERAFIGVEVILKPELYLGIVNTIGSLCISAIFVNDLI
jgi:hypothetical protein